MPIYFLVHDPATFHDTIYPVLAACWQKRSFRPCVAAEAILLTAAASYAKRYSIVLEETILGQLQRGLAFDRGVWRLLVSEVLLFLARDIPELATAPDAWCRLLAPDRSLEGEVLRPQFAPIQQALFGTRDLVLGGGYYRPDQAGWNDVADVTRIAHYLESIDARAWTKADLENLPELTDDEERAEELEYARDWFPELAGMYHRAREEKQLIVCETMQSVWAG
jgi:hypothetical protein